MSYSHWRKNLRIVLYCNLYYPIQALTTSLYMYESWIISSCIISCLCFLTRWILLIEMKTWTILFTRIVNDAMSCQDVCVYVYAEQQQYNLNNSRKSELAICTSSAYSALLSGQTHFLYHEIVYRHIGGRERVHNYEHIWILKIKLLLTDKRFVSHGLFRRRWLFLV